MKHDPTNPQTWLIRAISNLKHAEPFSKDPEILLEDLCFDAQQAAEKALKAVCVYMQIPIAKTHSLIYLMDVIEEKGIVIPEIVRKADILTRYAVETRYPGFDEEIEESEYLEALVLAYRVVSWAKKIVNGE